MKQYGKDYLPSISFVQKSEIIPNIQSIRKIAPKNKHHYLLAKNASTSNLSNNTPTNNNNVSIIGEGRNEYTQSNLPINSILRLDPDLTYMETSPRDDNFSQDQTFSNIKKLQKSDQTISLPVIQQQNIFRDLNVNLMKQNDLTLGPKYLNNKIVNRSIVGKVEWFNKLNQKFLDRDKLIDQNTTKPIHILKIKKRTSLNKDDDARSKASSKILSRVTSKLPTQIGMQQKKMDKYLNTSEIQDIISKIEHRLEKNSQLEKYSERKMGFQKLQSLRKDTKALNKYQSNENDWNTFMLNSSISLQRDPQDSQLLDLYDYRIKREHILANDSLRNNFNNKYVKLWEMKIKEDINPFNDTDGLLIRQPNLVPILLCELQSNNINGKLLDQPTLNDVAIVRKPYITNNNEESLNISLIKSICPEKKEQAFQSFTTQEYLYDRYKLYLNHALKNQQLQDQIEIQPDQLIVIGRSQLEYETSNISTGNQDFYKMTEIVPLIEETQIIEQSYDFKHYHGQFD